MASHIGFDTLMLHAGQRPDPTTGARAAPLYQSTSFVFDDSEHAASLFNVSRAGHVYSRISNPTVAVLEERMAALEGGVGAVATASGMAAIHLAITTLAGAGSHIVASRALYGGTHNLLAYTLPRFGIETTFVDPQKPEEWAAAIRDNTRLCFGEIVANPGCEVMNVPVIADIAHKHGVPLVIDSTLTPPCLIKPFEHGADIVVHSLTKFVGGHGVAIGGCVVDSGKFDWRDSGKFAQLSEPYEGFHGMNFVEEFGPAAFAMRARKEGLRDFGASLSPANAFYLLQGCETLSMRMQRHIENARTVVEFLSQQDVVESVAYPELPDHPDKDLAAELLPKGCTAVFSFELKGGRDAGRRFIEGLSLFSHLANVGDAKSLVIHPATTTHSRMDAEALLEAGISEGLIRLSIGLEDHNDLIADLKRALRASQKGRRS
ncbi:O-acetylhomoserine aminocarboxypropyltransferase [Chromatiales bacterium (ex Bugula neritina AB1)]|nr:O-acetylhomoserine aminocarboxypropyltransferase [Chromatiales bacterium (ex Bugula neritina AB1)]